MLSEAWQQGLSIAIVTLCTAFSLRKILGWSALRSLRRLAQHSFAIQHCFALVDRVPPDSLRPDTRNALSAILHHHLSGATKQRPGHPYLNTQALQILRFSAAGASAPFNRQRPNANALTALYELENVLADALAENVISNVEHLRAMNALAVAVSTLETELLKRKALSATHLRRDGEALAYLKSALQSASAIPNGAAELRELTSRIESLESAY